MRWAAWASIRLGRLLSVLGSFAIFTLLFVIADRFTAFPQGLNAKYFSDTPTASAPVFSARDAQPSTDHLIEAWHGSPPQVFSTTWKGAIVTPREGLYTFATVSDDGSSVYIDGQLVVDNHGTHGARTATGSMQLARGAHALLINYDQDGALFHFDFLWARDGSRLERVPAWALRSRSSNTLLRVLPSVALTLALVAIEWVWFVIFLAACAGAVWLSVTRVVESLHRTADWSSLRWILGGSLVLNLVGIWWGLPGAWVPIELTPGLVFGAASQHFSRGWYDAYPPLHFYILTIAMSPAAFLRSLSGVDISDTVIYTLMVVLSRLISVAAATGTVIVVYRCGIEAFERRAGLFAAAIMALTTPFVYYAKTANVDVPYLFWFALSLLFYLRLLQSSRLKDYVLFGASATLAVCTKDQAYGLYLLAPVVIVNEMRRVNRRAGLPHPLRKALFDRRLVAGTATAAVLFAVCHNLMFNSSGFIDHVRLIIGPASTTYRMFEPTIAGHLALLRLTGHLIEVSLGWPLFLTALAGLLVAGATPRLRRRAAWLAVPVISYYFGFINVILYNYDRFVLPICLVLALFGGLALDTFLRTTGRGTPWRTIGVAGLFAYTVLYAVTVDVLMVEDSRYAAERWMKAHIGKSETVGVAGGLVELLPRLDDFQTIEFVDVEQLRSQNPAYFVVNADYARAVPADTPWGQINTGLQGGSLGYRLVFRFRRSTPWPWLPGAHPDLMGPRQETAVFSTLRNLSPMIEVFQRDPSLAPTAALKRP